ncbi:hypothetical protein ABK040_005865 [Willaertia magna]
MISNTIEQRNTPLSELNAEEILTNVQQDTLSCINFEKQFVTQVYNDIAPHFSHTRYSKWPFIQQFIQNKQKCLIGDIGCGNGKYMQSFSTTLNQYNKENTKDINNNLFIGTDISEGLLTICNKEKHLEVLISDNALLPLKSNLFDAVLSVAVIHHFASNERRIKAIKELFRIIKVGGEVLIYVWAFEQKKKNHTENRFPTQDMFVPWHLQKQFEVNKKQETKEEQVKEEDNNNNVEQPTDNIGKIYKRYYHLFKEGELEELVRQALKEDIEFKFIKSNYYERDNWGVVIKKL